MRLIDTRLTGCANSPMRSHQCGSLRDHGRVLRKGFLPPGVKTVGGGILIRMRLSVAQPFARSEELTALWVQLLVRIHFVLSLPLPGFILLKSQPQSALVVRVRRQGTMIALARRFASVLRSDWSSQHGSPLVNIRCGLAPVEAESSFTQRRRGCY